MKKEDFQNILQLQNLMKQLKNENEKLINKQIKIKTK